MRTHAEGLKYTVDLSSRVISSAPPLWLVAVATAIWLRSRKSQVNHKNVNDDWEGNDSAGTGRRSASDTRSETAAAP
jgi:hypothetical protein